MYNTIEPPLADQPISAVDRMSSSQFIGRTGEDFEDNIDEKSVGGEFTLFELNKLIKSGNHSTIDELLDTFYISCGKLGDKTRESCLMILKCLISIFETTLTSSLSHILILAFLRVHTDYSQQEFCLFLWVLFRLQ